MPFPPTFDRAFDETFPPDTQAANLLGQDIRNLKTDIRERFALLSGTFANRPTNEDAAFGGVGYGMLYFSTDTNQIFQWNGVTWVEVSSSFSRVGLVNSQANLAPVAGNGAAQVVFTYNLPANTVANLQGLRLSAAIQHSIGAFNINYIFSLNGIPFLNTSSVSSINNTFNIVNTGAATGVFNVGNNVMGTLAGLNWANAQVLSVTFNAPNTDTIVPILWLVELLR
jgi:hypothetical protein